MDADRSIELAEIMAPRLGSVDPSEYATEEFELYSIPAFDVGKPEIVKGSEIGSSKQLVQSGDLLLSRIVPHIRRAWVVPAGTGRRKIASGEWIVFRSRQIEPRYLRHLLVGDSFHVNFMRTVSGVGGSLLRARPAYVAKIRVPLHSLPEQRRIAAILDKADSLRAKRRAAIAQLDTLAESIFLDIHKQAGGRSRLVPFVSIAEPTRGSFVNGPFGSNLLTSELREDGVPVIYIRDIRDGEYSRVSESYVSERKARELAVCSVKSGDVLISKVGDPPGIAAVYPEGEADGIVTQDVIRIRTLSTVALPNFIAGYLNSVVGKRKVFGITVAATRARFSLKDLKALTIELPPIELQQEYARRVISVQTAKGAQRTMLDGLNTLFESIQYHAFGGGI